MNDSKILKAASEAKRFLKAVEEYHAARSTYTTNGYTFEHGRPKQSGAMRRASMDLTRALADMRKP